MENTFENTSPDRLYIYFDGDDIGNHLELLLLDGKLKEAKLFSESIHRSFEKISKVLLSLNGACLVFSGGDDVVCMCDKTAWDANLSNKFQKEFQKATGCSLSGGVGTSIQEALMNLRRAKLSGKNRIIFNER